MRTGSRGTAGFLALWLAGWSFGCVLMGVKAVFEPGSFPLVAIIPFYAAWIFVGCIEVFQIFGREELRLGLEGLRYRLRAIVTISDRTIPLDQVKAVVADPEAPPSDDASQSAGVTVITLGRPLRVGQGLETDSRRQLAGLLDEHLRGLTPALIAEPPSARKGDRVWPPGPALPEGSPLRIDREYDGFRLTRRYPFSLRVFGGATFFVAFWDGIVSVFVQQALTKREWAMLAFISIHATIGLLLLLGWLWLIVAPFCRRTWTFRPFEIIERFSAFGLPWSRHREPPQPARVELRKGDPPRRGKFPLWTGSNPLGETPFAVALVDPGGGDRIVVNGLTEGEALCLESELCHLYSSGKAPPVALQETTPAGPLWDPWLDDRWTTPER